VHISLKGFRFVFVRIYFDLLDNKYCLKCEGFKIGDGWKLFYFIYIPPMFGMLSTESVFPVITGEFICILFYESIFLLYLNYCVRITPGVLGEFSN